MNSRWITAGGRGIFGLFTGRYMSIPINRNMGCTTYYCSCRACVVRNLLIIITGKGIDTIVATAIDALDFAACDCNIGISIYDAIFMLWFSIVWIPDCSTTTKYLVSSSPFPLIKDIVG